MARYYFRINAREGAPGCADDVSYTSEPLNSFAETYRALFRFAPESYWYHLRSVQSMEIWLEGNKKVKVSIGGCYQIELDDLVRLNATEAEFDGVIAVINKEQENKR